VGLFGVLVDYGTVILVWNALVPYAKPTPCALGCVEVKDAEITLDVRPLARKLAIWPRKRFSAATLRHQAQWLDRLVLSRNSASPT
jgi:hypothetical protein